MNKILSHSMQKVVVGLWVLKATFNNNLAKSWWSVLLVEITDISGASRLSVTRYTQI